MYRSESLFVLHCGERFPFLNSHENDKKMVGFENNVQTKIKICSRTSRIIQNIQKLRSEALKMAVDSYIDVIRKRSEALKILFTTTFANESNRWILWFYCWFQFLFLSINHQNSHLQMSTFISIYTSNVEWFNEKRKLSATEWRLNEKRFRKILFSFGSWFVYPVLSKSDRFISASALRMLIIF